MSAFSEVTTPMCAAISKSRVELLIEQRKQLCRQRKSAAADDGITAAKKRVLKDEGAQRLSLIESAKLEPALANPSWTSNELERITAQLAPHLLHRRREMWINSSNNLLWRPPSNKADPATLMSATVPVKATPSSIPEKRQVPVSRCPFGTFLDDVADVRFKQ